jgi:hypothetical protein
MGSVKPYGQDGLQQTHCVDEQIGERIRDGPAAQVGERRETRAESAPVP